MRTRINRGKWITLVDYLLGRHDVETAAILFGEVLRDRDEDVLIIRRVVSVPDDAYLERRIDRLRIDPVALNRLVRPARDKGWSIIMAHSHPGTSTPWFSWADDAGDERLMPSFAVQIPGVPHGSMVVAGENGSATLRLFDGATSNPAVLVVVGRAFTRWPAATSASSDSHHRQLLALGESGQAALAQLRVGVVGTGGTGSVVAAQLAHLGVREVVLVDGDAVELSNISRIVGATAGDVGKPKVDVAARYARSLGVDVRAVHGALLHAGDVQELYGCDVVFSCVDRHVPRALLNRFAYDVCVPVIDLGTVFRVDASGLVTGDGGRVVLVGPERPCMACWGLLDPERLRVEQLSREELARGQAEGYVQGADVHQPAVISFNTTVAGAAVTELLRMVTGFAGSDEPPDRLSFSFSSGTVRRTRLPAGTSCRICGRPEPTETVAARALTADTLVEVPAVSFGMSSFDEILTRLKRSIASAVTGASVDEFYIGRSVNMEGRSSDHGCHEIRCLYETDSIERALDLEGALIEHFYDNPKNTNDQVHAGGSTADGTQHIYLALWLA